MQSITVHEDDDRFFASPYVEMSSLILLSLNLG